MAWLKKRGDCRSMAFEGCFFTHQGAEQGWLHLTEGENEDRTFQRRPWGTQGRINSKFRRLQPVGSLGAHPPFLFLGGR